MSEPADRREQRARSWASEVLGWTNPDWAPASSDASFRRYFRVRKDGESRVVMDAPPEREALAPFIDIAGRLAEAGLHVPAVEAFDAKRGYILLGDLGSTPYHHVLDGENADALFDDAIEALIRMQRTTRVDGLPDYDAALLLGELSLFPDWFLADHWRVEPTDAELDEWELVCMTLIRWALDQPQVFVHRDFMPRNLMRATPNPGILDFQDAVRGPIAYDPVCLFRDAFLSWPAEQVDEWLEDYRVRALSAGLPVPASAELWRRTCDFIGVHRHLKVLGIFARIRYRDGKPHYLEDAPRFFSYLDHAVARNAELTGLGRLLAQWKSRRTEP